MYHLHFYQYLNHLKLRFHLSYQTIGQSIINFVDSHLAWNILVV